VVELTALTIEQLAQQTGMSVRNIRAHQSRGLLPPPDVRGRTGYYGAEHAARLQLIQEMQADGFNLAAIQHLLARPGRAGEELLGFKRALMTPFETEQAEIIDEAELLERFPGGNDESPAALRERAERLGLIRSLGDGRIEVPSPRLLHAGEQMIALGVPLEAGIKLVEDLRKPAAAAARQFVQLYFDSVWHPFERAGFPEDGWPAIREALDRLRPLATEVLRSVFEQTMTQATEQAFGREAEKLRKRGGKRR
jgi:DNA-binding transcriptional MerR regulator